MDDHQLADVVIAQAASDLRRMRRHADRLDQLAWLVPAIVLVQLLVLVGDGTTAAFTPSILLAAAIAWAVLRARALELHRRVDEAMLAVAGPVPEVA